jgi:hypothetical protein
MIGSRSSFQQAVAWMERSAIQENARDESDFGHVAGRS